MNQQQAENEMGLPAPEGGEVYDAEAEQRIRRISRRSFLWAGATASGTLGGLWAFNKYAPDDGTGTKTVLRRAHQFNEGVARRLFAPNRGNAPEYSVDRAVTPRNNYNGNTPEIDLADWRLHLKGSAGNKEQKLTLADIHALPRVSATTELKCVEGWSVLVNWGGARFRDFAEKYPPPPGTKYVSMRSEPEGWEDDWYYVGLDIESCLHPQTLLAYEMNGKPLNAEHGAPLRLAIPNKYGIKNIKLITQITYEPERPNDYWADRGYDWYAGL